jgi:electron transfer flavoprotein alpha subunit
VLLPGNARGEEVAALLAGQLRTAWIPDAISLSASQGGAVEIAAVLPGGKLSRNFRPCGQNPVVATMRAGVAEIRPGGAQALMRDEVPVNLDRVPELTTVRQFIAADPKTADLVFADRIVAAGRGTGGADGVALVARLAEALGASLWFASRG